MMVYGIKNCSTVKKALTWFDSHKIKYEFYDLKKEALDATTLNAWFKKLPSHLTWDMLINKSGMLGEILQIERKSSEINKKLPFN